MFGRHVCNGSVLSRGLQQFDDDSAMLLCFVVVVVGLFDWRRYCWSRLQIQAARPFIFTSDGFADFFAPLCVTVVTND